MNSDTLNRMVSPDQRKRFSKEVKRALPPWGLILIGTLALGLAISCMVSAFGG